MSDRIARFRDSLGSAESYLHALKIMFEGSMSEPGLSKDYCAFHLVAEAAEKEVKAAQRLVDELEDEE